MQATSSTVTPSRATRPGDGAHHGQTVVPVGDHLSPAPTLGSTGDVQTVVVLDHRNAQRPQEGRDRRQSVALLDAQLGGVPQPGDALGAGGGERPDGEFVDEQRDLGRSHVDGAERARPDPDRPRGLES